MKNDIILSGVGGQGILSIAATIGLAAVANDLFSKTIRSSWYEPAGWRCSVSSEAF